MKYYFRKKPEERRRIYKFLFYTAVIFVVFTNGSDFTPINSLGGTDSGSLSGMTGDKYGDEISEVINVVDGDTVDVRLNGRMERIRLIGINTPETVDPRKSVECFGVESSNKAKTVLAGKKVALFRDSTQEDKDKYGRFLRYVFLEDGTNFNLLMIREGYAYEYTYDLPYEYQMEFKTAEREARNKKSGLWGGCK